MCIDYALQPRLSSRLTLGGRAFPRKPYPYGDTDFNRIYRYSCPDSHFQPLHSHLPFLLRCCWNAFLPLRKAESTTSVRILSPDHFRRKLSRWVSYYALFKWWLPLSQHPHCQRKFTSFSTEIRLGTLVGGLGCFPLDHEAYPPQSDCHANHDGIRSLIRFGKPVSPLAFSVLYPHRLYMTLYLNIFRKEPAITGFD